VRVDARGWWKSRGNVWPRRVRGRGGGEIKEIGSLESGGWCAVGNGGARNCDRFGPPQLPRSFAPLNFNQLAGCVAAGCARGGCTRSVAGTEGGQSGHRGDDISVLCRSKTRPALCLGLVDPICKPAAPRAAGRGRRETGPSSELARGGGEIERSLARAIHSICPTFTASITRDDCDGSAIG